MRWFRMMFWKLRLFYFTSWNPHFIFISNVSYWRQLLATSAEEARMVRYAPCHPTKLTSHANQLEEKSSHGSCTDAINSSSVCAVRRGSESVRLRATFISCMLWETLCVSVCEGLGNTAYVQAIHGDCFSLISTL